MHLDVTNRSSANAQRHLNCEDAEGGQQVIMVCIADAEWTAAALRTACWIARSKGARIVLLAAAQTDDMHISAANRAAPAGSNAKSISMPLRGTTNDENWGGRRDAVGPRGVATRHSPLAIFSSVALETCCETVEDFGLDCEVRRCVDPSQPSAIVAAACSSRANIVFARLPGSRLPLWSAVQYRSLRWRLAELGCDLYVDEFPHVEGMFATYTLP